MRKIAKGQPISQYVLCLKSVAEWKSIPTQLKQDVAKHILIAEQELLSAYTEKLLSADDKDLHIDHFIKQVFLKPKETLCWDNFFADVHSGTDKFGADYKDNGKWTPIKSKSDNLNLINPAVEDPHYFFCYTTQGEIIARQNLTDQEKRRALLTRDAFNLNHPSLVAERHDLFMQIISMKKGGLVIAEIKSFLLSKPFPFSYPSVIEYFCDECFDAL